MDRKKLAIGILAILSMVPGIIYPLSSFAETSALGPPTKVSLIQPQSTLRDLYEAIYQAIFIYKLDAVMGTPKADIDRIYVGQRHGDSTIAYDIGSIDIGRKGWTRYYPFSIRGSRFIMRIFLEKERTYQSDTTVLFEGRVDSPPIIFQVLPPVNALLASCPSKPRTYYYDPMLSSTCP